MIERLIPRIEDFEENVEASIKTYKDVLLRKIEVSRISDVLASTMQSVEKFSRN